MANSTNWRAACTAWFLAVVATAQAATGVDAKLAAAKLAEGRGEFAAAERELRDALAGSSGAAKERVVVELNALLARLGRGAEVGNDKAAKPQEPEKAGDPVRRLIAQLEEGSSDNERVKAAVKELQSLGALVVTPLLAELPRMGPFGLANGMQLFGRLDDARIGAALQKVIEVGDPTVATLVADHLLAQGPTTIARLLDVLVSRELPVATQCKLLLAARAGASEQQFRAVVAKIPRSADVERWLADNLDASKGGWQDEAMKQLLDANDPSARSTAMISWIGAHPEVNEDQALALVTKCDATVQAGVAAAVASKHPAWAGVALIALRANRGEPDALHRFASVEWWRAADESAPLLLSLPCVRSNRAQAEELVDILRQFVDRKWQVPESLQESLAGLAERVVDSHGAWTLFVSALPEDAEARALTTWAGIPQDQRARLVCAAVRAARPWHLLVAKHIASAAPNVDASHFARDWSGAPAEAIDLLVATVQRFPRPTDGGRLPWHDAVVKAYARWDNLPAALVLPLAHQPDAWSALATKHPREALRFARVPANRRGNGQMLASLPALAEKHGDAEDVPAVVDAVVANRGVGYFNTDSPECEFLRRFAAGNLAVVQQIDDARPAFVNGAWQFLLATQLASGVRIEQLADLLQRRDHLHQDHFQAAMARLHRDIRAEHAPLLAKALDELAKAPGRIDFGVTHSTLHLLAATLDPSALPAVKRLLARESLQAELATKAAETALAVAGPQRREVVVDLLKSSQAAAVAVALSVPELRGDAELLAQAKAAMLRTCEQLDPDDKAFANLAPDDAITLASDLLASDRLPKMRQGLCRAALTALGRAKVTGSVAPAIARAAAHPDAIVRQTAADELGNTFSREAAPFLLEMLKDRDESVRQVAQKSLDRIANYLDARAKWADRIK